MTYGLPQRSALIVLATNGGEIANTALGFKLDKGPRDRLEKDGLITLDRRARPMTLRLTDKGWRAFEDEMVAEPPPRSGSAGPALYAVLHTLSRLLADRAPREALRGAMIGGPPPASTGATGAAPAAPAKPAPLTGAGASDDIEGGLRSAYRSLAAKPRAWVELDQLRTALPGVAREEVDDALLRMLHAKDIEMTAHEDRGSLTKAQRQAALRVGRIDMHLISFRD